ncbi:hypothetical protein ACIQM4_01450 [Streptomyces sp. NPDC091272]|uniref:hypothetical protein n=1 Tax=Streptomyces sp. NPDC091272 TaxID=3365981 RepID=UPI00380F1CEB
MREQKDEQKVEQKVEQKDERPGGPGRVPMADCVLCGKPTDYPETVRGVVHCPVCEWQEGQRTACSG